MPSTLKATWPAAKVVVAEPPDADGGDSAGAHPKLIAPHVATKAIARSDSVFRMIKLLKWKQNPKRHADRMLVSACPAALKSTGYRQPIHLNNPAKPRD